MSNVYELRLSDRLQEAFGVPFDASVKMTPRGITVVARPSSDRHDMVRIEGAIANKTRLQVRARPEGYSRPLFDSMAHAKLAMRQRCAMHLDELYERGSTMGFRASVNGADLRATPASEWPESWGSFEYGFTVFPLGEHDGRDELIEEGCDWIIRAFRPIFDLLEVAIEVEGYPEGDAQQILSTKYERDRRNRDACVAAHGTACSICGFDFGRVYGRIGCGLIHVHHIVPVSKLGPGYVIDPVNDLIPVCPNCHAMLHRFEPPMLPEELKKVLSRQATHPPGSDAT